MSTFEYSILAMTSPTISDIALQDLVLGDLGIKAEARTVSILTEDGRRTETALIDLGPFTLRVIMSVAKIRKLVPDLQYRQYDYNDRMDSPEMAVAAPTTDRVPKWINAVIKATFEDLKALFLHGSIAPGTILRARDLVELANRWGSDACKEVVGLLFALSLTKQGTTHLNVYREFDMLGVSRNPLNRSATTFRWFVESAVAEMELRIVDADNDIASWKSLIEGFLAKRWRSRFVSFANLGQRCGLFERRRIGRDLYWEWVVKPVRERILAFAKDPDVGPEEFMDLAALLPPRGYKVDRRLSETSAFKVVYRGQDSDGNRVALKRYKTWESARVRQVLSRLALKEEDVVKKDSLTHWLGKIRHTNVLPCMVVKNAKGEIFIIEPLLDETLEATIPREPTVLVQLVREVSDAVTFIHREGLVHGDIKPENIGIQKGRAVLLDFGIASFSSPHPRARDNPGSVKTRAPELFSETAVPTFASDVWAVGATVMALASGGEYPLLSRKEVKRLPPPGDPKRVSLERAILNRIEVFRRSPSSLEKRIRRTLSGVIKPVLEVVLAACKLNPADRPRADMLTDLLPDSAELHDGGPPRSTKGISSLGTPGSKG